MRVRCYLAWGCPQVGNVGPESKVKYRSLRFLCSSSMLGWNNGTLLSTSGDVFKEMAMISFMTSSPSQKQTLVIATQ